MINWNATKHESKLISAIANRALKLADWPDDKMTTHMDICATHCNGCPLDLQKLLDAPDFDFAHDLYGIRRHINRETGKLEGFFLPRCYRSPKSAQSIANSVISENYGRKRKATK